LSDAWAELGPISDETGVFVHKPRSGSAAAEAGLNHGDVVVTADGQELDTHFILQGVVGGHQSGEAIELRVRRGTGELEDITVVRP
jgi:S1-C subfamily serine protease